MVAIAPSLSSTLYAGANEEVFKSIDGGLSWAMPGSLPYGFSGFYVSALAIDPTNTDVVYVAQQVSTFPGPDTGKIFKSTDGGGQWREVPVPVAAPVAIWSLAIDPATPSIVYAAYSGNADKGGVFKSSDSGETWIVAQNGLPDTIFVNALAIDPSMPARIYATTDHGVFMSTDAAASWTPINSGLTSLHVWSLSIDRTGSLLRAATADGLFEYQVFESSPSGTLPVIEYFYAAFAHYFITSNPDEINKLDSEGTHRLGAHGAPVQCLRGAKREFRTGLPVLQRSVRAKELALLHAIRHRVRHHASGSRVDARERRRVRHRSSCC